MLVAVPLAFQQQACIVHLDRQMSILPQSVVYKVHSQMGHWGARLMKAGVKFAAEWCFNCQTLEILFHGSGRVEWCLERLSINQNSLNWAHMSARICPAEASLSNALSKNFKSFLSVEAVYTSLWPWGCYHNCLRLQFLFVVVVFWHKPLVQTWSVG